MLLVICRKYEAMTVFRIIRAIDHDAFITQANVNGVYGQGFDELKLKMKAPVHGNKNAAATTSATNNESNNK